MKSLKDKQLVSSQHHNLLDHNFHGVSKCLLKCKECIDELLHDPRDPNASKVMDYPINAKFTYSKQKGGLILHSPAVLKIVKATEVLFKKRV